MTLLNINLDKKGNTKITKEYKIYGDNKKTEVLLDGKAVWNSNKERWELPLLDKVKLTSMMIKRQVINTGKNDTVVTMAATNAVIHALLNTDVVKGVQVFAKTYVALVGVYSVGGLTLEIVNGAYDID